MGRPPAGPDELAAIEARIDAWLAAELARNPLLVDVTRADDVPLRWYVRLQGEDKDFTTIWMTLGQRSLRYEAYFLPAPEENRAEMYEYLLRRNLGLVGARFAIGDEDAIFLSGEIAAHTVDEDELDRIVGSVYAYAERHFRPALRIGFASRFAH
jgi:Putative bacterial sensory transduction regulator